MTAQTSGLTYHVHLASELVDELDVESPVETDHIDYYDTGLWVSHESGRDFYPYHQVLTIHERPAAERTGSGAGTTEGGPAEQDEHPKE